MNDASSSSCATQSAPLRTVDDAITSRRSIRAFLPEPVPREVITDILRVAARAPSGSNVQPWKVHVLTGHTLSRVCDAILAQYNDPQYAAEHQEPYFYYPRTWVEPYLARRRKVGWDVYGLLDIGKTDKTRMHAQHGRNFRFFDAPMGLIFTMDRILEQGSWLDYGMFLQSIMIAARARGLDTCPQAAFNQFHRVITHELGIGDDQVVVCGMALGHADPDAIENSLVTERAALADFVRFHDDT